MEHPEDTVDSHVNPQHGQRAFPSEVPQRAMLQMIWDLDRPHGLLEEGEERWWKRMAKLSDISSRLNLSSFSSSLYTRETDP